MSKSITESPSDPFRDAPDTRLLETVADIAWLAGRVRHHRGDSREDVQTYVSWAREFEAGRTVLPDGTEQYPGEPGQQEYLSAIETFTTAKLNT